MVTLSWWTVRNLPRATLPVVRAALRRDRPLAVTYLAVGLCAALHLAIVVTGIGLLAALSWPILGFLGVLALIVGIVRNRRRRSRHPA